MTEILHILPSNTALRGNDGITYIIEDKIGEGGFGILYKGYIEGNESETVAIKQINPQCIVNDATIQQMQKNELEMLKKLSKTQSGYVPAYHDCFESEGFQFLVMDFIHGSDLKNWLADRRLSVEETYGLLLPIATTLFAMHKQGCFHGDLSPQNIMIVTEQGHANQAPQFRFVDFGFSIEVVSKKKMLDHIQYAHNKGYSDPDYQLPPERNNFPTTVQYRGKLSEELMARDFYGLIAIAYFLITGKDPDPRNLDFTGMPRATGQFFESRLKKGHAKLRNDIQEADIPAEVELNLFIQGLHSMPVRNHKPLSIGIALLLIIVSIFVFVKMYRKEPTNQAEITFPSSEQQINSETEIWTQRFEDYYNGAFTREDMGKFFTEDAFFLVKISDSYLVGNANDQLFAINQLINDKFTPEYRIGTDYTVVDIQRDETSGRVQRIVIEKIK